MNHVMIDIESLGKNNDAPVLSIGAVYFDPMTGNLGEEFYENVDIESSLAAGAIPDGDTVKWWFEQSKEAQDAVMRDAEPIEEALRRLRYFLGKAKNNDLQVWGNGPTFDLTILASAYRSIGQVAPWAFWSERCVRTIVEMGRMRGLDPKRTSRFEGIAHYALDDAKHQAKYVSAIWQHLIGQ